MGSKLASHKRAAPSRPEERPMRQANRLSESTKRPPFRWRAELLSRLSGPGGLYNFGDALGFGSGLLIAYLGGGSRRDSLDNVFSIGMRYVAGSPAAVALDDSHGDLLRQWGSLPSGLGERLSPRYEIDADRRSFLGFRRDRTWRRPVPARQSRPCRNFGLLHAAGKFGSASTPRVSSRSRGAAWTPARSAASSS